MTDDAVKAELTDRQALALTMWGEGRGDWRQGHSSLEERVAVGCVIRNRLAHAATFGAAEATYRAVCLAPRQFSCWFQGGGAINYAVVMAMAERIVHGVALNDGLVVESLFLADGIMGGALVDRTGGATMYYAPKAMVPPGRVPTSAVNRPMQPIGDQLFYTT